jgi:hypothetical protein
MGATAITVLAGARILSLSASLPAVKATAGFVEGFSFALWAFGTCRVRRQGPDPGSR